MPTYPTERIPPAPSIDPTNKPFFDAAREHRLLIGLCRDTGRHFFYPRGSSPFTLSPNVTLIEAAGTGIIYSFTIARGREPYALAYVELTEGPRILTNIVGCDLDTLRIGAQVEVVWQVTDDGDTCVPMFKPA